METCLDIANYFFSRFELKTEINLSHILSIFIALIGWLVVHWLNSNRDQKKRRDDLRVQYLLESFHGIVNSAGRLSENGKKYEEGFEKAVDLIQLLGSADQVRALKIELDKFEKRDPGFSLDNLLLDIRNTIRADLKLKPIEEKIFRWRFDEKPKNYHINFHMPPQNYSNPDDNE